MYFGAILFGWLLGFGSTLLALGYVLFYVKPLAFSSSAFDDDSGTGYLR